MSLSPLKELSQIDNRSAWGKHALLEFVRARSFTVDEQVELISYIVENFKLVISPHMDYLHYPLVDDKIIQVMDDWDTAWRTIINSQAGKYRGYREDLRALQTLCN